MCDNVLENAHFERISGSMKNQYLDYWHKDIHSEEQLCNDTHRAVMTYHAERVHSSIG